MQEINNLNLKEPTVSEHAMLRFLERAMGISMEELEHKVLPPHVKEQVCALGDGDYPIEQGVFARVRNNKVVTVIAKSKSI